MFIFIYTTAFTTLFSTIICNLPRLYYIPLNLLSTQLTCVQYYEHCYKHDYDHYIYYIIPLYITFIVIAFADK